MASRLSAGLTLASLPLIAAIPAFQAGNMVLAWVFVGVFACLCLLTIAPRVPLLHQLPPPVGAMPPPRVTFQLETKAGMSFEMVSPEEAVLLRIGLQNDQRDEIPKVHFNASVAGSTQIRRCLPNGGAHPGQGTMMWADSPDGRHFYWYDQVEVPPQHLLLHFVVDLPGPGTYPVELKLWSSSFYEKEDQVFKSEIRALPARGASEAR